MCFSKKIEKSNILEFSLYLVYLKAFVMIQEAEDCCNFCADCVCSILCLIGVVGYGFVLIGLPLMFWDDLSQTVFGGIPFYAWVFAWCGGTILMIIGAFTYAWYSDFCNATPKLAEEPQADYEAQKQWFYIRKELAFVVFTFTLLIWFGLGLYGFIIGLNTLDSTTIAGTGIALSVITGCVFGLIVARVKHTSRLSNYSGSNGGTAHNNNNNVLTIVVMTANAPSNAPSNHAMVA